MKEVEFKGTVVPLQYSKYYKLIQRLDDFFPRGIHKKDIKIVYTKENINNNDLAKLNTKFQQLLIERNIILNYK